MKHLNEGESIFVQGSAKKPYEIKMVGGTIFCNCPAWRNQSLSTDQRTCKHIKANVSNLWPPTASTSNTSPTISNKQVSAVVKDTAPPCLLAHTWDGDQNIDGWWMSSKLDGVRAWWNGETFWSRLGNEYHAPQWFKDAMPKGGVVLDGELYAGNGKFQETVSTVRKLVPNDKEWESIKYAVFDLPEHKGPFEERQEILSGILVGKSRCFKVAQTKLNQGSYIFEALKQAESNGDEGIMLRQPESSYESGRSHTLLKVKSFKDCEVTVVGYEKGKGRHKGRMGALNVKMDNGVEFNVGSGFSDKDRENPPVLGSRITIKYQELSRDLVPRFPGFWRKFHPRFPGFWRKFQ